MAKATYKDSGVDLEVYRQSMARLPRLLHRTHSPRVIPNDGGFAGLFQLDFANALFARKYEEPVLVSCTDGVGTKLKVATSTGVHNTVGIDLVAMSVNDALCTGAEPLFFLDYVAMSHDDPALLEQIVEGVSAGCLEADCALMGGETAIMPDLYARGDYDLAGFCVAVAEKKKLIDGRSISPDDVILGLASSGLHSQRLQPGAEDRIRRGRPGRGRRGRRIGANGRRGADHAHADLRAGGAHVLGYYSVKNVVHGIAHITGGGLHENLERILPEGIQAVIERGSWTAPPIFSWLARLGEVDADEMDRVFNMGIGLVLIVSPYYAEAIRHQLADFGIESWTIGRTAAGVRGVAWG